MVLSKKKAIVFVTVLSLILLLQSISALSIIDVSSTPEKIEPGQIAEISIKLKNTFSYDIDGLNIKLDLSGDIPFAPYQSSSEEFVDDLNSDEKESFLFKIIALPNAQSGIYKIPVEITYENEFGNISSKSELISITISSQPELNLAIEDSDVLIKGKENTLSLKLINSGLSDAKFVYINPQDSVGMKFISENEQYLGDVDSDDFYTSDYSVFIEQNAPNIITLPVIIKYKDANNEEFTESRTITVHVYSQEEAQKLGLSPSKNYTVYIAIVVVLILFFIWRRKRRKKKHTNI